MLGKRECSAEKWRESLPVGAVHVWTSELDPTSGMLAQCYGQLSACERVRAERFHSVLDRHRFIVAHGWVRDRLSMYCGTEPHLLMINRTLTGKPILLKEDGAPSRFRFNLSHSERYAVLAIAVDQEVGADMEYIHSSVQHERLAERFFSPHEQATISGAPLCDRRRLFFRYWVGKEAVLKGRGTGLAASLSHCELRFSGYDTACVHWQEDSKSEEQWIVRYLAPGPDYVAAIAAPGPDWHVVLCR